MTHARRHGTRIALAVLLALGFGPHAPRLATAAGCLEFTIAASAKMGGSISPAGAVPAVCQQKFTITPGPCYAIGAVIVDGVNVGAVSSYTFTDIAADHTIHAEFVIRTQTINVSAALGGGISPGTQTIDCGTSRIFAIVPDGEHVIADVRVDGVSVGPVTSYAFLNVTTNRSILAEFTPRVSIGDARATEGDGDGSGLDFGVILPANTMQPVSVHYQTQSGTADPADGDFVPASGDLNFVPQPPVFSHKWGGPGANPGQFMNPTAVAVDDQGLVYVADYGRNRFQKFDANGVFLAQWGGFGALDGQFNGPSGIAVDHSGYMYVVDSNNHRVQKFAADGEFLIQWGGFGSAIGQFNAPAGIDVDIDGSVYVADQMNHRIQKFAPDGTFLLAFGTFGAGSGQFNTVTDVAVDEKGSVYAGDFGNRRIHKWTTGGAFVSSFTLPGVATPAGVAVDGTGCVFVTDPADDEVWVFDANGAQLGYWGTPGAGDGQFDNPYGVAVNARGQVYVTDLANHRIQRFSPVAPMATVHVAAAGDTRFEQNEGFTVVLSSPVRAALGKSTGHGLIVNDDPVEASIADTSAPEGSGGTGTLAFTARLSGSIDLPVTVHYRTEQGSATLADHDYEDASGDITWAPPPPVFLTRWGTMGGSNGMFNFASSPFTGVAVDGAGSVLVTDRGNSRVQKFGPGGAFLHKWGFAGAGGGQFSNPTGIAVDPWGAVYVADHGNRRIQKFDSNGSLITAWGSAGSGNGQFNDPLGVAVDASGFVYVVDGANRRVQKFDASGAFVTAWGAPGSGNGQFLAPVGVAVDPAGFVYVSDGNHRVQKFTSAGGFVSSWGTPGTANGQFTNPTGIGVDAKGFVYVADGGGRVQKFDSGGAFIAAWGSTGNGDGQFQTPQGAAVSGAGSVYVADAGLHRVQRFGPSAPTGLITVSVSSDSTIESDETLLLVLSDPVNATLADSVATGTIANDDSLTSVHVDPRDLVFAASVAPNPAREGGVLAFSTTREGRASVRVYDVRGRAVRTLLDTGSLAAGPHRLALGANSDRPLSPGLYFYRVEAAEGILGGRFVLIR